MPSPLLNEPLRLTEADLKRLGVIRQWLLDKAAGCVNRAAVARCGGNLAVDETIAERWDKLANQAEADAQLLKDIVDSVR